MARNKKRHAAELQMLRKQCDDNGIRVPFNATKAYMLKKLPAVPNLPPLPPSTSSSLRLQLPSLQSRTFSISKHLLDHLVVLLTEIRTNIHTRMTTRLEVATLSTQWFLFELFSAGVAVAWSVVEQGGYWGGEGAWRGCVTWALMGGGPWLVIAGLLGWEKALTLMILWDLGVDGLWEQDWDRIWE